MSDETRDLAARIRDALRGVTPGEWRVNFDAVRQNDTGETYAHAVEASEWSDDHVELRIREVVQIRAVDPHARADALLIAVAPSLLRAALARIEADAATIAALREALAEAFDLYWRGVHMAEDRGYSGDNVDADLDARLRRNGDRIRELGALVGRDITALAHLNYVTAGGNDDDAR